MPTGTLITASRVSGHGDGVQGGAQIRGQVRARRKDQPDELSLICQSICACELLLADEDAR
jgi:hypothetical protein